MPNKEVHVGDDWYLDENNNGDLILVNSNTGKVVKVVDKETGDEDKKGNSLNNQLLSEANVRTDPRTFQNNVLPSIQNLGNETKIKTIDSHIANSYGRLWIMRARSSTGKYLLYYASSATEISLMYSDDAWSWTDYGSNPVISTIGRNFQVIKIDGTYYGYYDKGDDTIYVQTSSDGLNWSGETQLLTVGAGWENSDMRYPSVVHQEGRFFMYYFADGGKALGLATSNKPNGNFEKYPLNPVIVGGQTGFSDYGTEGTNMRIGDPHATLIGNSIVMGATGVTEHTDTNNWTRGYDENAGLYFSDDGFNFFPHKDNPIYGYEDVLADHECLNLNFHIFENELRCYFTTRTSPDTGITGDLYEAKADLVGGI